MSARSFQATTGVQRFYDQHDLGGRGMEPDHFYYNAAARMIDRYRERGPMFVFVYLAANHLPWDYRYRPDLLPQWKDLGNVPPVDEYLRRQAMSAQDYSEFVARLKRDFPDESFLLVRFGDHQPDFASFIMEPDLDESGIARRLMANDPRYFTTYYAIDAINFTPVGRVLGARYAGRALPAAGPAGGGRPAARSVLCRAKKDFAALRWSVLWLCGGAEARHFNRMLIDAGLIKNLSLLWMTR